MATSSIDFVQSAIGVGSRVEIGVGTDPYMLGPCIDLARPASRPDEDPYPAITHRGDPALGASPAPPVHGAGCVACGAL